VHVFVSHVVRLRRVIQCKNPAGTLLNVSWKSGNLLGCRHPVSAWVWLSLLVCGRVQILLNFCIHCIYILLMHMLISVPSLGVYYFLSVMLSVCPDVCLSHSFKLLLLFCFLMELSHFLAVISPCGTTKHCSSIFHLGPLMPKICTKWPISWLLWQMDWRCLHLPGGFRGWSIQWNHAKCCGTDPCCHVYDIWARRGDRSPTGLSRLAFGLLQVLPHQFLEICFIWGGGLALPDVVP